MTIFQVFLKDGISWLGSQVSLFPLDIRIDTKQTERVGLHDFICPCEYILLNCNLSDNYVVARELIRNPMS